MRSGHAAGRRGSWPGRAQRAGHLPAGLRGWACAEGAPPMGRAPGLSLLRVAATRFSPFLPLLSGPTRPALAPSKHCPRSQADLLGQYTPTLLSPSTAPAYPRRPASSALPLPSAPPHTQQWRYGHRTFALAALPPYLPIPPPSPRFF